MTTEEFKKLFNRIKRIQQNLSQKSGLGFIWNYAFPDGDTHSYRITNVKNQKKSKTKSPIYFFGRGVRKITSKNS
jgi:hypothetical protein